MKELLKIVLAFFVFICFSSCENPNPSSGQLPPITTEGKGTFGYKVNGEVQGQCYDGLFTSLANAEIAGDSAFKIHESCDNNAFAIYLKYDSLHENLDYFLNSSSLVRYSAPNKSSFKNDIKDAIFKIRFLRIERNKKIIAGTFSGQLFNENGESVEITDGRFDLIYTEY